MGHPVLSQVSDVREDEADSANNEVRGTFLRAHGHQLHGNRHRVGSQDESIVIEIDEAEEEGRAAPHRKDIRLWRAVGRERVVMTVENGDGTGLEQRLHRGGLVVVDANGDKSLPRRCLAGGTGPVVVEQSGRDGNRLDDGGWGDPRLEHGDGGGHEGDTLGGFGLGGSGVALQVYGQDLIDGKALGGEDSV